MTWICATCGAAHDALPTVYGAEAPWRRVEEIAHVVLGHAKRDA